VTAVLFNWVVFIVMIFIPTLLIRCIERKRREKR